MSKLYIAILCFALLALVACSDNLFGSSSESNCGNDVKCWRLKAENEFRDGNYEASYKSYGEILKLDSTASIGYFGMAKAGLWMKGINPFDVFRYVDTDDDKIPFISDSIVTQNRYLQGMRIAAIPLSKLKTRDSLTTLYELHQKNDPANQSDSLSKFREDFCGNSKTGACYDNSKNPREPFPLSDMEYKYNSYYGGLLISIMAKTLLEFFDTNEDGCITRRGGIPKVDNPGDEKDTKAWEKWGCEKKGDRFGYDLPVKLVKDSTGNFSVDLSQTLESIEIDYQYYLDHPDEPLPQEIDDINKKIDDFNGNMNDVIDILNVSGGESEDSWQEEMNKYKDFAAFYRVSTRIDEDGDGCIDEELLNGQDNDGDGIKGENSRLASLDPDSPIFGKTGINHSMIGTNPEDPASINNSINLPVVLGYVDISVPPEDRTTPYYICNTSDCSAQTPLWGDSTGLVTAVGFTQEPGYWITDDLELKLKVAQDTACPPQYDLDFRKINVGGCWQYYDNEKFVNYWLKRKLARDKKRIHPTCEACTSTACLQ